MGSSSSGSQIQFSANISADQGIGVNRAIADILTIAELRSVSSTRWVLSRKGEDEKARLIARGHTQDVTNVDTHISTPLLYFFKILQLSGNADTALLHAELLNHESIEASRGLLEELQ